MMEQATPTKKFKLKSVLSSGNYEPFVDQVTTNLESSITELGDSLIQRIQDIYEATREGDNRLDHDDSSNNDEEGSNLHHSSAIGSCSNDGEGDQDRDRDGSTQEQFEKPIFQVDEITNLCKQNLERILHTSQSQLIRIVEMLHTKENEVRNHMRSHYDEKLKICRMSYKLERDHNSSRAKIDALDMGEKMSDYYKGRMHQLNSQLVQCQDMRRVQDQTLMEYQQRLIRAETTLKETEGDFDTYKTEMEEKCAKLEEILNMKRKQEVWAHFKILHLTKKLKKTEKILALKKRECKNKCSDIKELKSRLKTSLDIREGLERAFEKRASIRGRLDILHENNTLMQRGTSRSWARPNTGTSQMTHGSIEDKNLNDPGLRKKVEVKHQGTDAPPFYANEVAQLQYEKEETQQRLNAAMESKEKKQRQNEAYQRLLSGKNLAVILAAKHRELRSEPNSLDAKLLYDLTEPHGALSSEPKLEKAANADEIIPKKRKTVTKSREKSFSVPKLKELPDCEGVCGRQIETPPESADGQHSSNEKHRYSTTINTFVDSSLYDDIVVPMVSSLPFHNF